jgi:hypothetical protein
MNEITEINTYTLDIELAESLKRLRKNKDFKRIIEELYLDGGSINLAKNIVVVKSQEDLVDQIKARGWLYRFLMEIEDAGYAAIEALKEDEE